MQASLPQQPSVHTQTCLHMIDSKGAHTFRGSSSSTCPPHTGHQCDCWPETLHRLPLVGLSRALCLCRHHRPGHCCHLRQRQRPQQILQQLVLQPQLAGALAANGCGSPPSAHAVAEPGHAQRPVPFCLGECKLCCFQSLPSGAAMQFCAGCSIHAQDCREVAGQCYVAGIHRLQCCREGLAAATAHILQLLWQESNGLVQQRAHC